MKNEYVEVDAKVEEGIPKMTVVFDSTENYYSNAMFRSVQEKVDGDDPCKLFVFFDMGSVILDTGDPRNHIIVHDAFVEIYNNDQMETTFIRTEKINGFLFEPKPVELEDLEEEALL